MDKQHNHNNSSQMKAVLSPDEHQNPPEVHEKEPSSGDSTHQGTSSSPSPGPSRRGAHAEGHESATQGEEGALSCCQLNDLKQLPTCHIKLGPLRADRTHTILINVECFNQRKEISPQEGRDLWHSDFVKMPCSQLMYQGQKWDVISNKLKSLASKKAVKVKDVEEAIIKYNPKYKDQWSFDALHTFNERIPKTENYFKTLFPKIAALALKLPDLVKKTIPLLQRGRSAAITLSQYQISCLLANAFFCTFPHRNTTSPNAEYSGYPSINFSGLFGTWSERKREKLRAIMHYFKVVTDTQPIGLVTFERRCLSHTEAPKWKSCKETLSKLHVTSKGHIEVDGKGMLQVDFASSWIGGGVLGSGLLQEEILFLMNPELIVARLFTEKLGENECLIITGSQQFSSYSGFADTFEWAGPYQDDVGRDDWNRLKRQILAIDALKFKDRMNQYNMKDIVRELNKAYCGFKGYHHGPEEPDIATGKWGCGAFNGDPQLKAVIQLMAAAKAKRGLAFFTFDDELLERNLQHIYNLMVKQKVTVEKLYRLLDDFCSLHHHQHVDLFEFISKNIGPSRSQL